jgi:hypothetical protein
VNRFFSVSIAYRSGGFLHSQRLLLQCHGATAGQAASILRLGTACGGRSVSGGGVDASRVRQMQGHEFGSPALTWKKTTRVAN